MTSSTIRRILLPLDGSPLAERALPHAAAVAHAFGAEILLLWVLAPERRSGQFAIESAQWRLRRSEAAAYLHGLATRLQARGLTVRVELSDGTVEDEILDVAQSEEVDLLVLTSHGRGGPTRFSLGGTASKIVWDGRSSFLLVRSGDAGAPTPADDDLSYERVLVAVDCSHRGDWALHLAAPIARASGSELVVAHVVPHPEMPQRKPDSPDHAGLVEQLVRANREAAEEYLEEVRARLSAPDLHVRTVLLDSADVIGALDELIDREQPDLVVLSAHGALGSSARPYGGVSASLISRGRVPVVVFQDLPRRPPDESGAGSELTAHATNGWSR